MAIDEKTHHVSGVLGQIKVDHFSIEALSSGRRYANRVHAIGHQNAIHHKPGRTLVAIEEKLLQSSEQKERKALLECRQVASTQSIHAGGEYPVQFGSTCDSRQRRITARLSQADIGRVVGLLPFATEMSPFQRLIPATIPCKPQNVALSSLNCSDLT